MSDREIEIIYTITQRVRASRLDQLESSVVKFRRNVEVSIPAVTFDKTQYFDPEGHGIEEFDEERLKGYKHDGSRRADDPDDKFCGSDHLTSCCAQHDVHVMPHRGCILR